MSSWLKPRYRIVADTYAGFEVQIWRWYWPFWVEANFSNTHSSEEGALTWARQHAQPVVKSLGRFGEDWK